MDVLDQLGSLREGKMSRRAFTNSLMAAGIGMVSVPVAGRRALASEVQPTYFTWGGYDIPELFGPFQSQHGTLPNFAVFGGSEEALTKMRGGFVVDVSHPCNQALIRWVDTGLFQPVDPSRLDAYDDLMPELIDQPGNTADDGKIWMAPFDWGQTSITYRTDLVDLEGGEESWSILWDERYAGRLGSIAAGASAWWCAAIYAGVPFEELDTPEAFEKIAEILRAQRPLIRTYTDDMTTLEQALASGEMVAAMTWNSSAATLRSEGHPVKFAQPKEGALTWVCGMMIHKDAPNLDGAYDIINAMLSTETGEFLIGSYNYGHSNARSFDAFTEEELTEIGLSKNPMEVLEAGKLMTPQTQEWETRMNTLWSEIKAGF